MNRRRFGLVLGGTAFVAMLAAPTPARLGAPGWHTAAVGVLMATWWVTEAIPIPATALLPLVLFPLLGVAAIRETAAPFANPIIYLFLGGFLLAGAMRRWGLPRRIALTSIRLFGTRPRAIVAGVMASSALLSMWVSNTATAIMMLPIGLSLIELVPGTRTDPERRGFATALMLGIAFGCSIGGMGTLIGTPPNTLLAGFMEETYGVRIGFAEWMLLGVPLVVVGLPLTHLLLTRVAFPVRFPEIPGGRDLLAEKVAALGPATTPERRVAMVFLATALLWIGRPLLEGVIPGLSDAGIGMAAAVVLFLIPAGSGEGTRLLSWEIAEETPWGVLILFGGGLSLAEAVRSTGLGEWIGGSVGGLAHWPVFLLVVVVILAVNLLTELTSNTATTATFLPVVASVAVGIGAAPLLLAVPAALSASAAFLLPVATPPNAIVYGSGVVTIGEMIRAGALVLLLFLVLVVAATHLIVPLVFGT